MKRKWEISEPDVNGLVDITTGAMQLPIADNVTEKYAKLRAAAPETNQQRDELLDVCKAFQQAISNYRTYGQRDEFDYCKYLSQVEGQINLAIANAEKQEGK